MRSFAPSTRVAETAATAPWKKDRRDSDSIIHSFIGNTQYIRMRKYILSVLTVALQAQTSAQKPPEPAEFQALQAHFDRAVAARHANAFHGITSVAQWEERKTRLRQNLARMLWHDYALPSTPPPARITNRAEHPTYVLENIVLETAPKVYATANLYLPRTGARPYPVVLYQCGHANKSYYAKHGAWFAAHGIAAMVMDNIEMGEVEFTHHGVYSRAWFHWYSRGFSPLAVELLNARRTVDYLVSRPDLDKNKIGATGRSGGGMTTFYLAALDERVKASAPVSGILSTNGWVRQRLTFAHCDCQYPVNSYGMLYSEIGAMIAPRVQLLANADADRGFPMNTFTDLAAKMSEIYKLYGAESALRTSVTPGGHSDIEVIRLPVYSFFLKEFLGQTAPLTSEGPIDEPKPEALVCFRDGLPIDERLTRIDEELIPQRRITKLPELVTTLRNEVFRYFPSEKKPLDPKWTDEPAGQGRLVKKVTFTSFDGLRVRGIYSLPDKAAGKLPALLVVDDRKGIRVWGNEQPLERNQWGNRAVLIVETLDRGTRTLEANLRSSVDDDALHHMKRQAMVMGTTLESMQVYEILRSLELLRSLPEVDSARITVTGKGDAGINGLYAAVLDGNVEQTVIGSAPASHRQGPHYLGILRFTDIPETIALMGRKVKLYGETPDALRGKASQCTSLAACLQ
jgi:cephalosporin-C deacetylase-like acetyl esterase